MTSSVNQDALKRYLYRWSPRWRRANGETDLKKAGFSIIGLSMLTRRKKLCLNIKGKEVHKQTFMPEFREKPPALVGYQWSMLCIRGKCLADSLSG
jgi:hypothetical protein